MGIQKLALETRQTDTMVGGSGAADPAPDLRHQLPGPTRMRKTSMHEGSLDCDQDLTMFMRELEEVVRKSWATLALKDISTTNLRQSLTM